MNFNILNTLIEALGSLNYLKTLVIIKMYDVKIEFNQDKSVIYLTLEGYTRAVDRYYYDAYCLLESIKGTLDNGN